jgi:hypothetical protein
MRGRLVACLLLVTVAVGSATAQTCAMTCLMLYGRWTVDNGEIYWYSACSTTVVAGHTYINCYYESSPFS